MSSLALGKTFFNQKELIFQPVHNKTYNKTCVTSKDSDQHVHPSHMARFLVYPSLDSLKAVEGTGNQQRLIRLHKCIS